MTSQIGSNKWLWARAFAVLAVLLIGFQSLLEPFGRDQGIHATIGYALGEGLVTYRDVFNIKPPLTTAVHLLSQVLFGHSMMSIRIFDLCAVAAVALGLVEIVRRAGYDVLFAIAAPVAFAVIYYSYDFWDHSQTDGWAGFLVVGAVLLMQSGWALSAGSPRRLRMFFAGFIFGLAFAFKYTIGGTGLLVFAPLLARQRFYWSDFFVCILGGVFALAIVVGLMVVSGAFAPFLDIQGFISSYLGYETLQKSLWNELRLPALNYDAAVIAAIVGLVILAGSVRQGKSPLLLAAAVLWAIGAWLSGNVQGKGFGYHFLPLVPVYGLLVGAAIYGFAGLSKRRSVQKLVVVALIAGFWMGSPALDAGRAGIAALRTNDPLATVRSSVFDEGDYSIAEAVEFAELLQARREPGDGLFLWGYETVVYFLVEEPPRYRYPYAWPFVVDFYDGRYTNDLLERLQADPPRHFVVQKNDATPWVTGRFESSAEILPQIDVLNSFLMDGYQLVLSTPRYDLFERNPSVL